MYIYTTIPLHSFEIDPYSTFPKKIGHRQRQVATEWVATSEVSSAIDPQVTMVLPGLFQK